MRPFRAFLTACLVSLSAYGGAVAQVPGIRQGPAAPATPVPTPAPAAEAEPESPRSAVAGFLDLAREGRFEKASGYLDIPGNLEGRTAELARKLKLVLDRDLWIDLEKLSGDPEGFLNDGLPADVEEVGTVKGPRGTVEHVRLVRRPRDGGAVWLFSPVTVARIPTWYDTLDNRVLLEHVPAALLRPGPRELLWWQWIAAIVLLVPAWWCGRALGWATRKVLLRIAARTSATWDEKILMKVRGPLAFAWMLLLQRGGLPLLGLYPPAEEFAVQLLKAGAIVAVFWAGFGTVSVAGELLAEAPWAAANATARSFLHFSVRFGRLLVVILGVLGAFSVLGIPVNNVLAGLGIGGIAIAFAAQKTVENFFGAVSIGVDQPLRVGDFVKAEGTLGTVESIGLRSTRIRTLDRTLVTVPNGKLADMQIETFAERDRIRMAVVVGLEYGTTAKQLRAVIAGIESLLRAHPKVWPDVIVRFVGFGASSLDLDVWAWFQTTDFAEFRDIRQEVLLGIMEVVEEAGTSFAFPTRTVHLVGTGAAATPQP